LGDDFSIVQNTLLFAVGVEKLLKGILYDINPLYILESPDFKNSVFIVYQSFIKNDSEIKKKGNDDNVIAFQSSVLRATVFSNAALENKNTLMKLKDARDKIVHHNLNKVDTDELRILLKRDFYPLLCAFTDEHSLGGQMNFFHNLHSKLAKISSSLQGDIEKQIKLKVESSRSYWDTLKGTSTFKRRKCELLTAEALRSDFAFPVDCPSCSNKAIVYTTPIMEFDNYTNQNKQTGLDTKALKCKFCNLELTDYKELDFLKIKPKIEEKESVLIDYSDDLIVNEE
jgi:hypothetical protein